VLYCGSIYTNKFGGGLPVCSYNSPVFWSVPVLYCGGAHANKFGGGLLVCSHNSLVFWSMFNKFGSGLPVCSHGSPVFWSMSVLCCGSTYANKFGGGLLVCSHGSLSLWAVPVSYYCGVDSWLYSYIIAWSSGSELYILSWGKRLWALKTALLLILSKEEEAYTTSLSFGWWALVRLWAFTTGGSSAGVLSMCGLISAWFRIIIVS
jgi:hypothetical protein